MKRNSFLCLLDAKHDRLNNIRSVRIRELCITACVIGEYNQPSVLKANFLNDSNLNVFHGLYQYSERNFREHDWDYLCPKVSLGKSRRGSLRQLDGVVVMRSRNLDLIHSLRWAFWGWSQLQFLGSSSLQQVENGIESQQTINVKQVSSCHQRLQSGESLLTGS